MPGACKCPCHSYGTWAIHPDAVPSIHAVTACESCVNAHCGVLIERRIWWDAPPLPPVRDPFQPPEPFRFVSGDGDE